MAADVGCYSLLIRAWMCCIRFESRGEYRVACSRNPSDSLARWAQIHTPMRQKEGCVTGCSANKAKGRLCSFRGMVTRDRYSWGTICLVGNPLLTERRRAWLWTTLYVSRSQGKLISSPLSGGDVAMEEEKSAWRAGSWCRSAADVARAGESRST